MGGECRKLNFAVFEIFNLECFLLARVLRVSELYDRRVSEYTGCCYQKERKGYMLYFCGY